MQGRMIETHRVDQMFRDGTLWFGIELARFPLPDLRDGDPVLVNGGSCRYFHSYDHRGVGINCYPDGLARWTQHVTGKSVMLFGDWRIPTPDELEAAGLARNHFAGRRGIPQNG